MRRPGKNKDKNFQKCSENKNAHAQTRSNILGTGTAFDAQNWYLVNLKDAINSIGMKTRFSTRVVKLVGINTDTWDQEASSRPT